MDLHQKVNNFFVNDFNHAFSLILASVFVGYTLQPMPKWIDRLFNSSYLSRFIVLVLIGLAEFYPVSKNKFFHIILTSIIILVLFDIFRYMDKFLY